MDLPHVTLYTDGSTDPNPGRGGYGAILLFNGESKSLSGAYQCTTNNRMELLAVIVGLEALVKRCKVSVYSDSRYVVNTVMRGWMRKKNADLWNRLDIAMWNHDVQFYWVKGHAGNKYNELADALAGSAMKSANPAVDKGYVNKVL